MGEQPARRIRMGMVGGGPGAFIGPVHRMGAELDGEIELVAGAFSQDPAKSREAGRSYGISEDRAYADFREMMVRERGRRDAMDVVCIVTPNHLHLPVATAAMENGFHVVSDKPATANLKEALALEDVVRRTGLLYGLTYTYTGYPMVREARRMVRGGALGAVRKVVVEYSQGWLTEALEKTGNKQAGWRTDPQQSGLGGAIGDIGVHAFNLLEYVTGRRVVEFCASLSAVVPGRALDDDCNMLLKLDNGAPGVLVVSQISAGERNDVRLHVYGEKGGLHWSHEKNTMLDLNLLDQPSQTLHAGAGYLSEPTRRLFRLPVGHPEGLIEAFANIYRDFASAVRARLADPKAELTDQVPGIEEGRRSMAFVEEAVASSAARAGWVTFRGR
ncbi:MAG TPA: Gfo/Idh/MocA family oxidoreductase [Acidobacteriaceae bacterium]|nr:Gfo/Idh/MocA family oxidoreductase [Acidobacteriaceae bacterium]